MGFVATYFIQPIISNSGYNLVNSIAYGILAVILLYILFNFFTKSLRIKINFKFLLALLPFVVIGSSVRAFVDAGSIGYGFWTVSPGIYLLITLFFLLSLLISMAVAKYLEKEYWWTCFTLGSIGAIGLWFWIQPSAFENIDIAGLSLLVLLLMGGACFYIFKQLKALWLTSRISFSAFLAQLFDSTNTALILFFVGGFEKHPIPRYIIELAGTPFAFIALKLAVVIPVIYALYQLKDEQFRDYLLIAVFVLGLAEGLRNLISLVLI